MLSDAVYWKGTRGKLLQHTYLQLHFSFAGAYRLCGSHTEAEKNQNIEGTQWLCKCTPASIHLCMQGNDALSCAYR